MQFQMDLRCSLYVQMENSNVCKSTALQTAIHFAIQPPKRGKGYTFQFLQKNPKKIFILLCNKDFQEIDEDKNRLSGWVRMRQLLGRHRQRRFVQLLKTLPDIQFKVTTSERRVMKTRQGMNEGELSSFSSKEKRVYITRLSRKISDAGDYQMRLPNGCFYMMHSSSDSLQVNSQVTYKELTGVRGLKGVYSKKI